MIEIKNDLPKKLFLFCFKRFVLYLFTGMNYLYLEINLPIHRFTDWPINQFTDWLIILVYQSSGLPVCQSI